MRVHYLQHVVFEGLGSIADWLEKCGAQVTSTQFFQSTSLPNPEELDLLVILGGPMSVNDEEKFPWLRLEKQFVRRVIDEGKPVLGICLGAQIIAACLGESVYPNRRKEIGWYPVYSRSAQTAGQFVFPDTIDVFHWHGETFDLPDRAKLLASSEACTNQAFQYGDRVIGLQFHLEVTPESIELLVQNCREELTPSKFVMPEETLLRIDQQQLTAINSLMEQVLEYLVRPSDSTPSD